MKIKQWMKVTYVEDSTNVKVDDKHYDKTRDGDKTFKYVAVYDNGVVVFYTK